MICLKKNLNQLQHVMQLIHMDVLDAIDPVNIHVQAIAPVTALLKHYKVMVAACSAMERAQMDVLIHAIQYVNQRLLSESNLVCKKNILQPLLYNEESSFQPFILKKWRIQNGFVINQFRSKK